MKYHGRKQTPTDVYGRFPFFAAISAIDQPSIVSVTQPCPLDADRSSCSLGVFEARACPHGVARPHKPDKVLRVARVIIRPAADSASTGQSLPKRVAQTPSLHVHPVSSKPQHRVQCRVRAQRQNSKKDTGWGSAVRQESGGNLPKHSNCQRDLESSTEGSGESACTRPQSPVVRSA
jgi:hypothetical protein